MFGKQMKWCSGHVASSISQTEVLSYMPIRYVERGITVNWFFLTSRSLCICLCQKTVVCIVHSCFKRMPNTNNRVYWFCTIFFEFVVFVSNLLKEVVGNDDNVSVKVNRYTLLSILLNNKKCAFLAWCTRIHALNYIYIYILSIVFAKFV